MIRKLLLWLIAIAAIGGALYGVYVWQQQEVDELKAQVTQLDTELAESKKRESPTANYEYTSTKGVVVKVYTPDFSTQLTSPVIVMGEVPGNWSFEADFPIKLLDDNGAVITQVTAQLQDDWMTEQLVPFVAKLPFDAVSSEGTLVLQKDNPSGLEVNDDSVSIPIKFA
jgi:hypothetical protein